MTSKHSAICDIDGCDNIKQVNDLCWTHTCAHPNCIRRIIGDSEGDLTSPYPTGNPYCVVHACRQPGCKDQCNHDGDYCKLHENKQ